MEVKIKNLKKAYDGFFKIVEAEIEHSRFDGSMQTIKRLCFERGDAVAAVVFDCETRELLLAEQFRYPAYARSRDSTTLELIAGMLNPGEDKDECIAREMQEELVDLKSGQQRIVDDKDKVLPGQARLASEDDQLMFFAGKELFCIAMK